MLVYGFGMFPSTNLPPQLSAGWAQEAEAVTPDGCLTVQLTGPKHAVPLPPGPRHTHPEGNIISRETSEAPVLLRLMWPARHS